MAQAGRQNVRFGDVESVGESRAGAGRDFLAGGVGHDDGGGGYREATHQ